MGMPKRREFIVNLHALCNLACKYCFVYQLKDTSWLKTPPTMNFVTIKQVAKWISLAAASEKLDEVVVIMFGGDPLLAGPKAVDLLARYLKLFVKAKLILSITTNGTLLGPSALSTLLKHNVRVTVSLDGGEAANDRNRRFRPSLRIADGRGSYEAITAGLTRLLQEPYRPLFRSLLTVIDLDNDPLEVYEELLRWMPPSIDFILPVATHDSPPAGLAENPAAYGEWLATIFDQWIDQPGAPPIRFFTTLLSHMKGKDDIRVDYVGVPPERQAIMIDTAGGIELLPYYAGVADGAKKTGLNIADHSLADALAHPGMQRPEPAAACSGCPARRFCYGGRIETRFSSANGYNNASVYCGSYYHLITHVHAEFSRRVNARKAHGGVA